MAPLSRLSRRRARGAILILVIGIVIVLTGLVLVFSRQMRVEVVASGNLEADLEADAIVSGAARHVLNRLVNNTVPTNLDNEIQSQAVTLGGGAFWIIRPDPKDEHRYAYGVTDEASKLNINNASVDVLMQLPGMTAELAASIVDWHNVANKTAPGGAESDYYLMLPEPYACKNSSFETLGELRLVKGATPDVLYGADLNRNGVVDSNESGSAAPLSAINGQSQCGVCKYLTVYSAVLNVTKGGTARVYAGDTSRNTLRALGNFLSRKLTGENIAAILSQLRNDPPSTNVLDFYVKSGMTIDDFRAIADSITTSQARVLRGLVNVNTAPREVLRCLPGLDDSDVDLLIATRTGSLTLDNIAWVAQALPKAKLPRIGGLITTKSYQYSADIVAVAGNGRGFKRCKYVFDLRTTPPSIVLREDLTNLGWPLDPQLLQSLKAGSADNRMWNNR